MNDNYLNILLPTISKEKKNVFLLGDFNVYLLKYDKHARRNDIMGSLSSYMFFFPYILHPTRVTGHSQAIIDNIFSSYLSKEALCDNLTSTISDHLPQVLFVPSMFSAHLLQNPTFLKEAGQTSVELILSWITLIKIGVTCSNLNANVNFSMENFVNNMNDLLDKHAPFKKLSKYKLKFKTKP